MSKSAGNGAPRFVLVMGDESDRCGVADVALAARAAAPPPPAINAALSRTLVDVQDIGRHLGTAGKTLAQGTVRLAYDVGALVGLAGKNVLDGTAALASSFLRSAEALTGAPSPPRKPPVRARSRREAADTDTGSSASPSA